MKRILISRTDGIGDVLLTLPLAGFLKKNLPGIEILFLGSEYTAPIIKSSIFVDKYYNWSETLKLTNENKVDFFKQMEADVIVHVFPNKVIGWCAKKAGIPIRIGTSHRLHHFTNCNKIVNFSRRSSNLHEAQLNFKLLKPVGFDSIPDLQTISSFYGLQKTAGIPVWLKSLIDPNRINIVLHPKSKGSAREWRLENYKRLIDLLYGSKYNLFVTGTEQEGKLMSNFLSENAGRVHDLTGKLTLEEMIGFIGNVDGIIACSTGPLHLAAALEKTTIGIFPPIRPMHPGRWAPLGKNASFLVSEESCTKCRKNTFCECINSISAESVAEMIKQSLEKAKVT